MGDIPLTVNWILDRGDRYFGTKEIVTRTASGIERSTYREVADQARRIATVLDDLGISAGGRVGTFGWNTARHLALYLAIPSSGRVMHTINIRYFPDQLVYTIDHAEDEAVFVDKSLLPLFAKHLDKIGTVQHIVVMDDGADCEIPDDPRIKDFAELVDERCPGGALRPRHRRAPGRRDLLHDRARPAIRRASSTRTARCGCTPTPA